MSQKRKRKGKNRDEDREYKLDSSSDDEGEYSDMQVTPNVPRVTRSKLQPPSIVITPITATSKAPLSPRTKKAKTKSPSKKSNSLSEDEAMLSSKANAASTPRKVKSASKVPTSAKLSPPSSPSYYSSSSETPKSPRKAPEERQREHMLTQRVTELWHLLEKPSTKDSPAPKIDRWTLQQALRKLFPHHNLPSNKLGMLETIAQVLEYKNKFASITVITNKLWLEIFSFLEPYPDLWNVRSTCSLWRKLLSTAGSQLWSRISYPLYLVLPKYSHLSSLHNLAGERTVVQMIERYSRHTLHYVDLRGISLNVLRSCIPYLENAKLEFLRLPAVEKDMIPSLCKIIEHSRHDLLAVDLQSTKVASDITEKNLINVLQRCPNLRKLGLPQGFHITSDVAYRWPKLQHIDIRGSTYTSAAVKVLSQQMRSFTFGFAKTGTLGESMLLGQNAYKLKHLYMQAEHLKDGDLYYIMKRLSSLESLSLHNAVKFTPKGLRKIAKYGINLKSIEITGGAVTDIVLAAICAYCRQLESLYLQNVNITDKSLVWLLKMPLLQNVCLLDCKYVTREGIANLMFCEQETKKHFIRPMKIRFEGTLPDHDFLDFEIEPDDSGSEQMEWSNTYRISEDDPLPELEMTSSYEFVLSEDEQPKSLPQYPVVQPNIFSM